MRFGTVFSGIGGPEIAAESLNWEILFHCEKNKFCQKILKYYWPKSTSYENIKNTNFSVWRGIVDVLAGGFPCQPFSDAGNKKGIDDDRYLWPEMLRAIRESQPPWVVGENVRGLVNWSEGLVFKQVQTDLETEGYEVLPLLYPACGVGAPHKRQRIFFVAYCHSFGERNREHYRKERQLQDKQKRKTSEAHTERDKRIHNPGEDGGNGVITNTGGKRLQGGKRCGADTTENTGREICARGTTPELGTSVFKQNPSTTHPSSKRLQWSNDNRGFRETRTKQEQSRYFAGPVRENWESFPNEHPICSGNDGFSNRLDRITVSTKRGSRTLNKKQSFGKWRKETIQAYGNAIVPKQIYPVFKTIQDYEEAYNRV